MKIVSGRIVRTTSAGKTPSPRRETTRTRSPSLIFELHRRLRMNLDVRFGTLLDEKTDAPRLIAGKILVDDAPARQYQADTLRPALLRTGCIQSA